MKKLAITYGAAWSCTNLDTLAPIDWEGYAVLFDDGSVEYLDDISDIKLASSEQEKSFYQKLGFLYIGDEVEIIKGRKLPIGEHKIVKSFIERTIPGTYGHCGYTYVIFEDGTACDIKNIRSIHSNDLAKEFKEPFYIGGRI